MAKRQSHHACRRRFNNGIIKKAATLSSGNINCGNINKNHLVRGGGGRQRQTLFDDQEQQTDRLSDLPDDIIHHIFSYLEIQAVVQTSFLSRRWRHLWTTCPHLNFHCSSPSFLHPSFLHRPLSLDKFVTNVLSYRNHNSLLEKVEADMYTSISCSNSIRASILDYAISHHVTHLTITFLYGTDLPQQLSACKSLKTLNLGGCHLPNQALHSLSLTTLHLSNCTFSENSECIDPFDACPNLNNLSLQGCYFLQARFVKISAPQVVELKIGSLCAAQVFYMDVDAPNLSTFIYAHTRRLLFSSVNFPNLEYADITYLRHEDKKEDCLSLFRLFEWLHNAQFFVLDSGVVEALSAVLNMLENQSSPFNRLKVLKLNRSNISSKVMSYLCNGSPHAEIKLLESPKV